MATFGLPEAEITTTETYINQAQAVATLLKYEYDWTVLSAWHV